MEIPRYWRLKKQLLGTKPVDSNPVRKHGIMGAINESVARQEEELKKTRELIKKEEEQEQISRSGIIFSSSK